MTHDVVLPFSLCLSLVAPRDENSVTGSRPHGAVAPSGVTTESLLALHYYAGRSLVRVATPAPLLPPPSAAGNASPTRADVDVLWGAATPHFAYQLRARLEELVADLPPDHDVRRYAEQRMELLDQLGHATSKGADGQPLGPTGQN
jgi:hypothetical protein